MTILIPVLIGFVALVVYEARRQPAVRADPAMRSVHGTSLGVVRALARVEGRKLLRHPVLWIGIAFCALIVLATGGGGLPIFQKDDQVYALFMFPFCGMFLIAVHLGIVRSRREGCDELFDTLPASPDTRTGGHLLSLAWGIAVSIIVLGVWLGVAYAQGGISRPDMGELLTGPLLVGCAGVVGVTLGRLVPNSFAGPFCVFALGVFQGLIDHFAGPYEHATNWFAPWVPDADLWTSAEVLPRRPWIHLVYLVGLGSFAAILGFTRHRRDRRVAVALLVSLAVIGAAGLIQSRPYTDGDLDLAARRIGAPGTLYGCRSVNDVRYCVYPGYEALIDQWRAPVEAVLQHVPDQPQPLEVLQRHPASAIWFAPAGIRARLPEGAPNQIGEVWPDDGAIHPNFNWCTSLSRMCTFSMAAATASWAVGLPLQPVTAAPDPRDPYAGPHFEGIDVSGQARAIVALWLAASSGPSARAHFLSKIARASRATVADGEPEETSTTFMIECEGIVEAGAEFGLIDARYAAQLLELPDEDVGTAVRARWATLTDPTTPTAAIVDLFDLREPDQRPGELETC